MTTRSVCLLAHQWLSLAVFAFLGGPLTYAYIPASPSNVTAIEGNSTDASHLTMQWYGGGYQEGVRYDLVGADSEGISEGVMVHFSEEGLSNETTSTPWIALIACDANATDASQNFDVFTLARDRGAVSALLYSLYSETCVIAPVYADPATFDHVLDIFTATSLNGSLNIETQYKNAGAPLYAFDASALNASASAVNATLTTGEVTSPGLVYALLVAGNATSSPSLRSSPANGTGGDGGNSTGDAGGNGTAAGQASATTSLRSGICQASFALSLCAFAVGVLLC
ncbi:hypothetical protein PsYK624_083010 [Phanerochaete sordida]|uniref:Uncharacterized protein n=1 Tax=Phanerochaete sordida TaxID=48140 RepID=A0A9P3GA08_9APHY|nr:hypothetical protein PsYK624_083010 [Phanerochaete sordida]